MKIALDAYPLSRDKLTGLGVYMQSLTKELQALDRENEYLLYTFKDIKLPFENQRWKVRLTNANPLNRMSTLWLTFGAKDMAERDKVDIFVGTQSFIPPNLTGAVKKVLVLHDLCIFSCPRNVPLYLYVPQRLLFPKSISAADRIIAISEATRADIKKFFPKVDEKIIKTVYYGGPDPVFSPCAKDGAKKFVLQRFNISDRFILTVASLEWRKNLTGLLHAFELCRKKYNIRHKLLIAGGERRKGAQEIERLYKKLGLEGSAYFLGHVDKDELKSLYNAADLMAFPSFYEGFGLPPLEAMSCGTPTLVSDIPVFREVMRDASLFADPCKPEELAEKIYEALSDNTLRDRLVQKGFERVKDFSWAGAARQMLEVFRSLEIR